jgi:haloalkane dehalogenase
MLSSSASVKIPQHLFPFERHYVGIGLHQMHYLEEGVGEPVVMLHGNPSWSFYYRHLIKVLSPYFHCIVPDHIGMGLSDKPGDDGYAYTLEQRISDIETFLQAKGIEKNITLILHDWGGIIGMGYARRHPASIKRIVLLNTAAFHLPSGKRLPFFIPFTRTALGAFFVRAFNSFSAGATRIGVTRKAMPPDVRRAYTAPYNSWNNRIATLRFVQGIPLKEGDPGYDIVSDMEANLHLFRQIPVLICWGMKDKVFDHHFLEKWIEYLPQSSVHRYEDCGHYVLEDATDEIGKQVLDFLRG